MNRIYQQITPLHPQYRMAAGMGDCHAAGLASLLNIPLESIPLNIRKVYTTDSDHYNKIQHWLKKRFGWELICVPAYFVNQYKHLFLYKRHYLAIRKYPTTHHVVVGYSGTIVHDPAPYKNNCHNGIVYYEFLAKFHPTIHYGIQRVDPEYQRCRELLMGPQRYINV